MGSYDTQLFLVKYRPIIPEINERTKKIVLCFVSPWYREIAVRAVRIRACANPLPGIWIVMGEN